MCVCVCGFQPVLAFVYKYFFSACYFVFLFAWLFVESHIYFMAMVSMNF